MKYLPPPGATLHDLDELRIELCGGFGNCTGIELGGTEVQIAW